MNKLNNAILFALYGHGQEISCTLAAIKIKVAKQNVVTNHEEILTALSMLINEGKIIDGRNTSDNVCWMLTAQTLVSMMEVERMHREIFNDLSSEARFHLIENMTMLADPIRGVKVSVVEQDVRQELAAPPAEIIIDDASVERRIHNASEGEVMEDTTLKISVRFHSDEDVAAKMKEMRDAGREKITSLNNCFAVGLMQTHYEIDAASVEGVEIGNGTGYYDPLAKAIFINEHGVAIGTGRSVRFLDTKSNRRLWIVVVKPGKNIIVHDRFSGAERGTFVCTTDLNNARDIIGMEPAWADGCTYDLAMACRLFGFEYDRRVNEVYMPRERKENGIDMMLNFFK